MGTVNIAEKECGDLSKFPSSKDIIDSEEYNKKYSTKSDKIVETPQFNEERIKKSNRHSYTIKEDKKMIKNGFEATLSSNGRFECDECPYKTDIKTNFKR